MLNAFTVDVEEWFHICGVPALADRRHWPALPSRIHTTTRRVLALAERANVRGTFFVLGWIAERYPELVTEIREAGHEIGSHGYGHERAWEIGPDRFEHDVAAGVAALRAAGMERVDVFRAPEWSINDRAPWALERLVRAGFRIDSSRAPLRRVGHPRYPQHPHVLHTPAGSILEAPPLVGRRATQHIPLGGGWGLRMTSPASVIAEIGKHNAARQPVTMWVHPWELDPEPPRIRLPLGLHVAHYFRLAGLEQRLASILGAVPFGTVSEMVAATPVAPYLAAAIPRHEKATA